jgi:rRNA maturation RNase YbeY
MITVEVESPEDDPPLPATDADSLVRAVLAESRIDAAEITVIFCDDEYLRSLKKTFLKIDAYTDVMAFELNEPGQPLEAEIYISIDRAAENSQTYGEKLDRELRRLIVHGALHLMGHKDHTPKQKRAMRTAEDRYLAAALTRTS